MSSTASTITEVPQGFAARLNRPHANDVTGERTCTGEQLASALAQTDLDSSEAQSWWLDLEAGRKALRSLED